MPEGKKCCLISLLYHKIEKSTEMWIFFVSRGWKERETQVHFSPGGRQGRQAESDGACAEDWSLALCRAARRFPVWGAEEGRRRVGKAVFYVKVENG